MENKKSLVLTIIFLFILFYFLDMLLDLLIPVCVIDERVNISNPYFKEITVSRIWFKHCNLTYGEYLEQQEYAWLNKTPVLGNISLAITNKKAGLFSKNPGSD